MAAGSAALFESFLTWLALDASLSATHRPSMVVAVTTDAPLDDAASTSTLEERPGRRRGADVCVVAVEAVASLPQAAQDRITQLTLPYTSRAFLQDVATMTECMRQDHVDHTVRGDILFVALVDAGADAGSAASTLPFRVVGHLLVSVVCLDGGSADASTSTASSLAAGHDQQRHH